MLGIKMQDTRCKIQDSRLKFILAACSLKLETLKICVLCGLSFCFFSFAAEAYEPFSPQQIMTLSKENPSEYIFLDVNEEGSASKIPNSVIMPLEKIDKNYSALDFNKTIVVYCQKGIRSLEASKKLSALGAKKVINMEGGIEAWEKAGGKVEKKTATTPLWPGGTCEIKLPE